MVSKLFGIVLIRNCTDTYFNRAVVLKFRKLQSSHTHAFACCHPDRVLTPLFLNQVPQARLVAGRWLVHTTRELESEHGHLYRRHHRHHGSGVQAEHGTRSQIQDARARPVLPQSVVRSDLHHSSVPCRKEPARGEILTLALSTQLGQTDQGARGGAESEQGRLIVLVPSYVYVDL